MGKIAKLGIADLRDVPPLNHDQAALENVRKIPRLDPESDHMFSVKVFQSLFQDRKAVREKESLDSLLKKWPLLREPVFLLEELALFFPRPITRIQLEQLWTKRWALLKTRLGVETMADVWTSIWNFRGKKTDPLDQSILFPKVIQNFQSKIEKE